MRALACVGLGGVVVAAALCVGCATDTAPEDGTSENAVTNAPASFAAPVAPRATRHPIVLVHAFNGSATNSWSFNGVTEALEADGHFVYAADLPPYNGTPERAAVLVKQLDVARNEFCEKQRPELDTQTCLEQTKVNLIGHSQGGLDGRWVISKLGYAAHVASLTTISAPHRGTPIGDFGLKAVGRAGPIADALFTFIAETRTSAEMARDTNIRDAFFWLSEQRATDPQYEMRDDPGVVYQSWAGVASSSGERNAEEANADRVACEGKIHGTAGRAGKFALLWDAQFRVLVPLFTRADQKPNDGHIPVSSAKWGEFRGCIPADHLDLVGRPAAQHRGASSAGFDHLTFYRVVANELAGRGL